MSILVYPDHEALSFEAACKILEVAETNPSAVLCLAAGETPGETYRLLTKVAQQRRIDFSRCTFIGLDEWVGIPPSNEGSCEYFLQKMLFTPLRIKDHQVHLFNALADDLDEECRKMNAIIRQKGGIDVMLVGVGMNGHIGFNEPGVSEGLYAHVTPLDQTTQTVGQKYFSVTTELTSGITLGLKHLLESRQVIALASGRRKARIIQVAVEGAISTSVPASILRKHRNSVVMLDTEAASLLEGKALRKA